MFKDGDLAQLLFDESGGNQRRNQRCGQSSLTLKLKAGKVQNTFFGSVTHDEIIGQGGAPHLRTSKGIDFYAVSPTIADATLAFPRGAAIIYPKDAAHIVTFGDISSGSRVLECGLGSGALTCSLLRAVGEKGGVTSVERREDFAKTATKNINDFFGNAPQNWHLVLEDFSDFLAHPRNATAGVRNEGAQNSGVRSSRDAATVDVATAPACPELPAVEMPPASETPPPVSKLEDNAALCANEHFDRIVLDLLNPWDFLDGIYQVAEKGAVLTCYITTITQMQSLASAFEARPQMYAHVDCFETIRRPWHLDGLSIRPEHQGIMHSGFIFTARVV